MCCISFTTIVCITDQRFEALKTEVIKTTFMMFFCPVRNVTDMVTTLYTVIE